MYVNMDTPTSIKSLGHALYALRNSKTCVDIAFALNPKYDGETIFVQALEIF